MAYGADYHVSMDDQAPRRESVAAGRKPVWRWVLALVLACCAIISSLILFFHLTGTGGSLTRVRPGVVFLAIAGLGVILLALLVVLGWLSVRANQRLAPHLPAPARWLVAALGVVVEVAAAVLALVGLLLLFLQQDDMYSTRIDGQAYYVEAGYPDPDGRHSVWRAKDLVRMTKVGYLDQGNSSVDGLDREGVKQLLLLVNHGRLGRGEIATFGGAALTGAAEGFEDVEAQAKAPSADDPQQETSPSAEPSPSDEPPSMAERCAAGADCYESVWTRQPVEVQVVQELVDALTLSKEGPDLLPVDGSGGTFALMTIDAAAGSRWTVIVEKAGNDGDWRFVSEVPTTSGIERASIRGDVIDVEPAGDEGSLAYRLDEVRWGG